MSEPLRVLIVDDSRSEYVLAREHLAEANPNGYAVEWAATYDDGLAALRAGAADVALVDYQLGAASGVELIREATAEGCPVPLILLTGRGERGVDLEALEAGAADYVEKADAPGPTLDRAIRYAVRHQRAADLLRRREERFRALIENSADVIVLFDSSARVLFASESGTAISGVAPAAAVGRSAFDFIHPDDVPHLRSVLEEAVAHPGAAIRTTYRAIGADGSCRYREGVFMNRLDDPAVGAIVLNSHDVTDRRLAEAQQAHLAAIVRSSDDAIIGLSLDGTIVSWNPGAERLYGYAPAEVVGRSGSFLIPPDRAGEFEDLLQRIRAGRRVGQYETVRLRKDGARVDVSVTLSPMHDANGTITGMSSVTRDISDRLRAEQAVRAAEERTRFTLEMAQIGLWDTDLVTGRSHWSDTMAAVTGLPVEGLPRTYDEFMALVHPDDRLNLPQAIERASRNGGRFIAEFRMTAPDGTVRWHEVKGRVFTDDAGVPLRALGVGIDVTERKRLEGQFRQAQKMEAIGHLAGGVAHDFNNMLTAILGYCEIVVEAVNDRPQVVADIGEIKQAGERATQLTKQLLAFSRRQHVEPRVFDLNRLVHDTEKMLARLIGEDLDIEVVQDRSAGAIRADPGQIEQVLMNLAVNARDAMPAGGRLTIATADARLDADFVRRHPGSVSGRHSCLVVRDTGCGMTPEVASHVFEPFYTTKQPGKGTGLGLSTVYGIVKQSGGYIEVESAPGMGTSFTVYFPTVDEPLDAASAPAAAAPTRTPNETILLVEDELAVRAVIAKTLTRAGYQVLVAEDPNQAMAIAASHEGSIDLLLSDVIMPHMSGPELAQRIVPHRPGIRVLYVSGFADRMGIDLGVRSGRTAFLHKPFTGAALREKVREQLDGRA
jgi:two-component system, cell cycle sensor histidine kinase and response regulator CckA